MIDTVIRCVKKGEEFKMNLASFYADDGFIESSNLVVIQTDLDNIIKSFEKIGFYTNKIKTKRMAVKGPAVLEALRKRLYDSIRSKKKNNTVLW